MTMTATPCARRYRHLLLVAVLLCAPFVSLGQTPGDESNPGDGTSTDPDTSNTAYYACCANARVNETMAASRTPYCVTLTSETYYECYQAYGGSLTAGTCSRLREENPGYCPEPKAEGACCVPYDATTGSPSSSESCFVGSQDSCDNYAGTWSEGAQCSEVECTYIVPGACCGVTSNGQADECRDVEDSTTCPSPSNFHAYASCADVAGSSSCPAPRGACCNVDANGNPVDSTSTTASYSNCTNHVTEDQCYGSWVKHGTCDASFSEDECPALSRGACCLEYSGSTTCQMVTEASCLAHNGTFSSTATCSSDLCHAAACCDDDGGCRTATRAECFEGGGKFHSYAQCTTTGLCPVGSCCALNEDGSDYACSDNALAVQCNGAFRPGGECADLGPLACKGGACCYGDECRSPTTRAQCANSNGFWHPDEECPTAKGDTTTLRDAEQKVTAACPALGACCLANSTNDGVAGAGDATCMNQVTRHRCVSELGGEFLPRDECVSNTECPRKWACCSSTPGTVPCVEATAAQCAAAGDRTHYPGSHCSDDGKCPLGRCCIEDNPLPECDDDFQICHNDPDWRVYRVPELNCTFAPCDQYGVDDNGDGTVDDETRPCSNDPSLAVSRVQPYGAFERCPLKCLATTAPQCRELNGEWSDSQTCPCERIGACCLESECKHVTRAKCHEYGGKFNAGTRCRSDPFGQLECPFGACCHRARNASDGDDLYTCTHLHHKYCALRKHSHFTPGVPCSQVSCYGGACCEQDAAGNSRCTVRRAEECNSNGGTLFLNEHCPASDTCPERHACCLNNDGTTTGTSASSSPPGCIQATETQCARYSGVSIVGETCVSHTECPKRRACCLDDSCEHLYPAQCRALNGTRFPYDDCEADNACPRRTACCIRPEEPPCSDRPCVCAQATTSVTPSRVSGETEAGVATCRCPDSCEKPTGCQEDLHACPDGSYVARDPDNWCAFHPCPTKCADLTPAECEHADGSHHDNAICDDKPCEPRGACCTGSECLVTTADECERKGGKYNGHNTNCDNPDAICPSACCIAATTDTGSSTATSAYCTEVTGPRCAELQGRFVSGSQCLSGQCPMGGCCTGTECLDDIHYRECDGKFRPATDCPSVEEQQCNSWCSFSACCTEDAADIGRTTTTSRACTQTTATECHRRGGNYSYGLTCEDPSTGGDICPDNSEVPCCLGDTDSTKTCAMVAPGVCRCRGGSVIAGAATCDDVASGECGLETGACCKPDGQCAMATPSDCEASGGEYSQGEQCTSNNECPPTFPCCIGGDDVVCSTDTKDCGDGIFVSRDPERGCLFRECANTNTEPATCAEEVTPRTCPDGTTLERDPNSCSFPSCPPTCVELTERKCKLRGGEIQTSGGDCNTTDICAVKGSCCFDHYIDADFSITCRESVSRRACVAEDGVWHPHTSCEEAECPEVPKGSCCTGDACISGVDEHYCNRQQGEFFQGQDCRSETECPLKGACCRQDTIAGTTVAPCSVTTKHECEKHFGRHLPGEDCNDDGTCPEPSGCCLEDGCANLLPKKCARNNGTRQRELCRDDRDICEKRACCGYEQGGSAVSFGTCVKSMATFAECRAHGGPEYDTWLQLPETCTEGDQCNAGACCYENDDGEAKCDDTVSAHHCYRNMSGHAWSLGESCDSDTCPQRGACCQDTECKRLTREQCKHAGGDDWHESTDCHRARDGSSICPFGACCRDGACEDTHARDCADGTFTAGGACEHTECARTYPCCHTNGTKCEEVTPLVCRSRLNGRVFYHSDTCGDDGSCPPTGSCCLEDSTADTLAGCKDDVSEGFCRAVSGAWTAGGECHSQTACDEPTWACCGASIGGTADECHELTVDNCKEAGGRPLVGLDCGNDTHPTCEEEEIKTCCIAEAVDPLPDCPDVLHECEDGTLVPLIPELGCEPAPCEPTVGCERDVKICHDGTTLVRDPDNYCLFPKCPGYCRETTERECKYANGRWGAADSCDDEPCAPKAACCIKDTLPVCTDDAMQCEDGTSVSRSPYLNCEFEPCGYDPATALCTDDAKQCPDGSYVSRKAEIFCAFEQCPDACLDTTRSKCWREYQGEWKHGKLCAHEPSPCEPERGSCCRYSDDGSTPMCMDAKTRRECAAVDGTWSEGSSCSDDDVCPARWACCLGTECKQLPVDECRRAGGEPHVNTSQCAGTADRPRCPFGACCAMAYVSARIAEGDTRPVPSGCRSNVHVDDCPMDSTGNHYNFAHGQTCADVGEYFCVPGACCGQYDVTPDDTTTSRCKFPTTARKCYLNQGVFHPWERCPSDTECPPSGACCLNGSPNSVTGTTSADGASTSFAPGCINNANRHYCKSQLGGEFFPNDKCTSHVECPAQSACCGSEHPDCRGCCMATPAQCRVYEGRHLPGQRCLQVASTTDPTTFVATCPRKGRCCWYDQRPVLEADNVTASIDTTVVSAEVDAVAFCTRDVRECPDGSVVSREPPTCQFPLCPPACLHVTEGECKRIGGSAWDGDEDCDDAEACLPRGSCCVSPSDWPTLSPQAWCVPDVTEKVCTVRYGGRFNEGTECSDVKCYEEPPIGSCCLANSAGDSRCKSEVTSTVCREEGGEFFRGQDCPSDTQCPIEGACCYGTADSPRCRHPMKWFACVSTIKGRFLPGERCPADDKCPEPAACCLGSGCTHATQYKCEVNGGVWHANDTCFATVDDTVADSTGVDAFAEASICEPRGPCCLPELCTDSLTVNDTACTRPCRELTRSQCDRLAGEFGEPGTRCTLDTCAARGKCCLPPDSSTGESQCVDDVTERTCKLRGGRFGAGSTCEVPCPAATRGACCDPTTNVACRVVNEADCPDTARFFANEECNRDGTCPLPGSCCVHKLVPVDDDDTNPDDPNDDDDDAGMCADRQSHVFGELEFDADVEWTHRFSRLDGINYYVVRTNWNESVGLTSNTQTSACVGANNDRSVLATGRNGIVGLSAIPIHLSFAEPACKMSVYFQVGGTNAVTLVASDGGNVIGSDKSEGTAVEDELSCGMPGPARRVGSVSLAVSRADYLNGAGITSAIISSGSSVMVIRAVEFCTCTPASATTATTATDSAVNAQYVRVTECHDDTTRATCGRLGGVHSPGDECLADDKCPVASACCIGTSGCLMRTPAQCRAVGGKLLENEQCQPTSTGGSIIGTCPTRASCCLNEPTYCTADVRKCPDNETYVSRVPPLCEFAPCDVPDFCPQDDVRVCPHSGVELQRDPRLGCQFPPCPPVCKDLTKYQCERLQGSWNEDAECDSLNGYCQVRGACCGANAENCRDGVGERLCKHNNGTFFGHKRCSDLTDDQCPIDRSGACCSAVDGGYRCGIVDQSNECDGQFYLGGNCDELQKDQCPLPRGSCCIAKDSNDEYTCRNSVTKATCDRFDGRWQLNTACADLTQEECPLDTNEPDVGACCSRLSTSVGGAVCADDVEATDCPVESAFFVNTTCARLPSDVCPVLGGCCLPDFVPGSMRYCLDNVPQTYCERYADGARWFRGVCSNSAGEPALTAAGLPVCPRPARKGACCLAGSSTSTTPCLDETTDAECERAEGEFFFRRRCANLTEDECSEKGSCCVVPEPPNAECFGHNFDADDLDVPRTNEFFVAGDDINVTYSVRVTSLNQILGVVPNSPAGTSSCIPADEDYYLLGSGVGGATSAPDDDIVGFSAFPITVRFSPPIAAFSLAAQVGGYSSVLVVGRDAAGSTLFRLTSDGVPTTEGNCGSQGGPARRHVEVSYAGALRRNLIHSIIVSSGQSVLTLRKLRGCRNAEEDDVSTNQAYCVDETTRRNCKQLGGSFNTDAPCSDLSQDVCPTDPPQQPEGACCLGIASSRTGRCRDSTTADTCDELGGRFYLERRCASLTETECSSLGACCVADRNRCFDDFPRRRCDDLNGTHSPRTECDDLTQEQCPTEVVEDPLYACCVRLSDGLAFCADTTADTCEDNQGHWTNGTECSGLSQDVCPTEDPRGSCCLRDPVSGDYRGCYDNLREDSCARHGGSWLEDVKCADRPSCQPPPPVVKGSCCLANSAGSLSAVWCLDDLEEDQCDTLTGSFNSNKTCVELTDTCTPPDTTPRGSCCTPNGQCLDRVIEERCTALEGYWHESIFCSTRPCVRLLIVRVLVVVHNINIDLLTEEQLEALRRAIALDCANAWNMAVTDIIVGAIRRQVDAATGADGAPKLSVRPEESGAVIEINVGQPVSNEEELEQFNEVVGTLLEDDIPFVNVAEAVPPTAKEDPTEPVAYDRTASKSEVATFSDPDYSNFDSPDSSGSGGSPVMFLVAGAIVALAAVGVVSWCRKKRNSRRPSDDVSSSRVQMSVPDDDQPGLQSRSGSGTRPYREGELGEL